MNRTDLIVVGAGPAGMSAAIEAAKHGAHVTVFDENSRPGGQLFKQIHKFFGSKEHHAKVRGFVIGEELMEEAARLGVDVRLDSTVIGLYQDKEVVVRKGGKVEAYVIIVLHRHAVRFQLVETVLRFRIPAGRKFTYIPVHIVHCDQEVGKYYGIVFHISPPYVQEPGNLVEGCQEYGVAAALHQFLSQPGYLMFAGPSHLFLSKGYDGRLRRGRTVLPDEVRKVRDVDDVELPVKAVNERHFLAESVNRYRGSLFRGRETGGQPLRDKDLVRDAGLV